MVKEPKVGDGVYIPTSLYMSHGEDDFQGGLCEIMGVAHNVFGMEGSTFVEVKERPGHNYNWKFLEEKQGELKERFGDARGHADPDYRLEFNRWD